MRRLLPVAAVLVLAGCGSRTTAGSSACPGGSPGAEASTASSGQLLARGFLHVSPVLDPGKPEHEFVFGQDVRKGATGRGGETLVVLLRDAGRPGQTCTSDHPLSGCVTIDWFDGHRSRGGRPFRNSATLDLASGPHTFFLRETGALAASPAPSRCVESNRYTALGGVARRWVGTLPAALAPEGGIGFRLALTKFGPPDVLVGYAVRVEP